MVHVNELLFTEEKWYLVSPINTAQWSTVVSDWVGAGIQAASDAVFHKYIYKLHQPVGNGETLTRDSWDQIDVTQTHDDLEAGAGYFVNVEIAGTTSITASITAIDENGSKRTQSTIRLYSIDSKDTYTEIKKADGTSIDEITDENGEVILTNIVFPTDKMIKIEFSGGVSNDTFISENDEDLYDDEDIEQNRITVESLDSIIDASNNSKPIVSNGIKELAGELFIMNMEAYDTIDDLKTKLEDSKIDVATSFDITKEDIDKQLIETTDNKLLDGIRKIKILQDTFIALDSSIDQDDNFVNRNKKLLQIKKGIVKTIKEKGGTQIDFTNTNDIDKLVEKVYDDSSSDPDKLALDNSYSISDKQTVKTNKKASIKSVFEVLDSDTDLNNETDKSEREKKFKIRQKEWKAQFRKQRKNKANIKDFELEAPTAWIPSRIDLKPIIDDEKNNIQCLFTHQNNTIDSSGNYEFNNIAYDINNKIALGSGVYTITNVSENHPIGFILRKQRYYNKLFSVSGDPSGGLVTLNGVDFQHYYNTVTITVKGNFGRASYNCLAHGYMGGENKLIYSNKCNILTPPVSIGIVANLSGSVTGTNNIKLLSTETVTLDISPPLDVNDKYNIFWEISSDNYHWSLLTSGDTLSASNIATLNNSYLRGILTIIRRDGFTLRKVSNVRQIEDVVSVIGHTYTYSLTGDGSHYYFTGHGLSNTPDPVLTITLNDTLVLENNTSYNYHPLVIDDPIGAQILGPVYGGSKLEFKPPSTGTYRYKCRAHVNMDGDIIVS